MSEKLYIVYPDFQDQWKFVLQVHIRGRSAHLDFRYEVKKGAILLGWTIAGIKALSHEPQNLEEAKKSVNSKLDELKRHFENPNSKHIAIQKKPQPHAWMRVDNETFEKGILGATSEKRGYMFKLDSGTVEFGALKPHFLEYWLDGKNELFHGRLVVRKLPNIWKQKALDEGEDIKTGKGYFVNMCWFADINDPYILSARAVKKEWMPPDNVPALPKFIRDQITPNFHFWKYKGSKALKIRNNLVEHNKKEKVDYSKS